MTYGEAFTVQPFGISLVTKTMTGDILRRLLEEQLVGCGGPGTQRILQIFSSTLLYQQNPTATTCARHIGQIWVNGVEVTPTDTYRVTMNSFLATGGDGFGVLTRAPTPSAGPRTSTPSRPN